MNGRARIDIQVTGLLALGFVTGFSSAALGIGGGVIMVPAFVLFFGYGIKEAIGTSLAVVAPVGLAGAVTHYLIKSGNIEFIAVLMVAIGSVAGANLGARLVSKVSGRFLGSLFALLLLFVGLKMSGIVNMPAETVADKAALPLFIVLGLAAGSASAIFGIGGGVIMVPGFNLFFGFNIHQAIATSLAVIFPTALAGAVFHKGFNNLRVDAIRYLVPFSLLGAVSGAMVSNMLPAGTLKVVFGILLVFVSFKMLFSRIRS